MPALGYRRGRQAAPIFRRAVVRHVFDRGTACSVLGSIVGGVLNSGWKRLGGLGEFPGRFHQSTGARPAFDRSRGTRRIAEGGWKARSFQTARIAGDKPRRSRAARAAACLPAIPPVQRARTACLRRRRGGIGLPNCRRGRRERIFVPRAPPTAVRRSPLLHSRRSRSIGCHLRRAAGGPTARSLFLLIRPSW
jgi:hypothetical protein